MSRVLIGAFLVVAFVVSLRPLPVGAVSGDCYFTSTHGPVTGTSGCAEADRGDCGTNDVFTGRNTSCGGGDVLKSVRSAGNKKTAFINFISNRFNSSNAQDRIGAHFIVCEFQGLRDYNACDLQAWKEVMGRSDITVDVITGYHVARTSWYDDDKHNTFYDNDDVYRDILRIRQGSKVIARLEIRCGNLIAGTVPPQGGWKISADTDSPASFTKPARAGTAIKWSHHLTNDGPDETGTSVTPKVRTVRVSSSGATTTVSTTTLSAIASGWNSGNTKDRSGSYTATAADEGARICQYIIAEPAKDHAPNSSVSSDRVCVKIQATPHVCQMTRTASGNDFWNMRARISTEQEEVDLGDTITWTHTISNNGPDVTDLPITWGFGGTDSGGNWTPGNINAGGDRSRTTTHVATQADVGTTYGRSTWVNSSGRYWSGWSGWSDASPANVSTSTSAPGNTKTSTAETKYRRVYDHTRYTWNVQTRHQTGTDKNGNPKYSSWSTTGSGSGRSVPSGSNTTRYVVTSSTTYYKTQQSTRTKHAAGRIETNPCGVYVAYDYQLTPSVTVDQDAAEAESPLVTTGTVHNAGPTKSEPTRWKITQIVYPTGTETPTNTRPIVGVEDVCTIYGTGSSSCEVKRTGTGLTVNTAPDAAVSAATTVPAVDAGSHVCFTLSIHSWRNRHDTDGGRPGDGPSTWRHSVVNCTVVSRKPKLHVLDGDLKVRGTITTSSSRIAGRTYGTWVDYGIFATGANAWAASGGGLRAGHSNASASAWSQLTFANTPGLGGYSLGQFSSLADYFAQQSSNAAATSSVAVPTTAGTHIVRSSAEDVTVTASGTVPVGTTVIIQAPSSTVTIDDDIFVDTDGVIARPRDIPQVVIVARNIKVNAHVKQVDAWLLARPDPAVPGSGAVETCADGPDGALTIDDCSAPLVVNGPVAADTLHARRTAGSTIALPGAAAETFRLPASTYLWLYAFANRGDAVQTTYVTEMPPRF